MSIRTAASSRAHRAHRARGSSVLRGLLVLGLIVAFSLTARPASAQSAQNRLQNDFGDLGRLFVELATQIGTKSRGQVLDFFNKVELFNVESEIDRLVGNPWELSDSTSYKLSLAPLHVAYPVFDQQVQQMTRLDDIRSRRIQNLTVDSLSLITVNLDILNGEQTGGQLASSLLHYFDAREVLDLGVFLLAQQPFFPKTQDEWESLRHRIASHQGLLALSVAGLGALVEAGAMNDSGTIQHCPNNACKVGWYGGFSHLGYHLQPNLRGGLTTQVPSLEMSAGLMEQIRAPADGASRVFEVALRESWLNRYTSASGWNSFMEAAIRRVLSAESRYHGETFTSRAGLFVKRVAPFRWRYITLRGSTEVESDLSGSMRYAMAFGVDYTKTGLSTVVQSSRTNIMHDSGPVPETRTALLLAGTVEAPDAYYVEAMKVRARLLRDEWNALAASEEARSQAEAEMRVLAGGQVSAYRLAPSFEAIRKATAESESHRVHVASMLGDYLEGRRIAYSLKQWERSPDDLQGPLDGEVLEAASGDVIERLVELAAFLRSARGRLETLRDRYSRTSENMESVDVGDVKVRSLATQELVEIDKTWRRESEAVSEALHLYNHYLASTQRIANLAGGLVPVRQMAPLSPHVLRKLFALVAQPLQ
ncbi:MAG TPA: hypothetical protein VIM14_18295 [Polyangia bacterium]